VGHINLSPLILIIKLLKPSTRVILIVHGIEVWNIKSFVQKKAIALTNIILAVSTFTKQKLLDNNLNISSNKIYLFPNTIEPSFLMKEAKPETLRKKWDIQDNDKIILTIARQSSKEQYKGYDIVLKSLPLIKNKFHISNIFWLANQT